MIYNNPLLDIDFLNEFVKENEREIYVRLTVLNNKENPVEYIEGKATDGNISIDGKSVIRRTCNLTLVADEININEFYWGLQNKFILEIGLKNTINFNYADIIWFKMGVYVITQFNTTQATNKWTVKIQGKDKMCLLNGDVSGNLFAENHNFSEIEYLDIENNTLSTALVPIKTIIQNIVHIFGGELLQNIIINDLDEDGLILLEYMNNEPAYLYKLKNDNEFKNIILDNSIICYYPVKEKITVEEYDSIPLKHLNLRKAYKKATIKDTGDVGTEEEYSGNIFSYYLFSLSDNDVIFRESFYRDNDDVIWFKGMISDDFAITYYNFLNNVEFNPEPTEVKFLIKEYDNDGNIIVEYPSKELYILAKLETGDMPGYYFTELTYTNGEKALVGKAGEALTSVLNKIKNTLVNYEYYYDVNGKFIFQKKTDYIMMPQSITGLTTEGLYRDSNLDRANIMFSFVDGKLVTSFQNNPKLTNVKNDFTIWGNYNINGVEIPIHMRYAIDVKPTKYKPIRPLKEEIHTIIEKDGKEINRTITYKYYDAPEPEPYLYSNLIRLEEGENKNGFTVTKITVPISNEYSKTVITYPYFVDHDYSVEPIYKYEYQSAFYQDPITGEPLGFTYDIELINQEFIKQSKYEYWDDFVQSLIPDEVKDIAIQKILVHPAVDWRELIYQMALDYNKCNQFDDFYYYVSSNNSQYPTGQTGYEQYYIDLTGFWRELYNPNPTKEYSSINFNELKISDLNKIYIDNGYRKLEFNDVYGDNSLSIDDLYVFNVQSKLYKFFQLVPQSSNPYHLFLNTNYYINEEGQMKSLTAITENSSAYETLNGLDLDNIYIQNVQPFAVKNTEKLSDPMTTYLQKNNNEDELYQQYLTPYYPRSTNLTTYADNYLKVLDVFWDQLTSNNDEWWILKNPSPDENGDREEYYIKNNSYQKMTDIVEDDRLEYYYGSFLTEIIRKTSDYQKNINKLNFIDYVEDNKQHQYLLDHYNIIYDYLNSISQYKFTDLDNGFLKIFKNIINIDYNLIIQTINNFIDENNDFIQEEYSCLLPIFEEYFKIFYDYAFNLLLKAENTVINQMLAIKGLYDNLKALSQRLIALYQEVKKVSEIYDKIKNLTSLDEINTILIEYIELLEKLEPSSLLSNGQVQLTLNNLKEVKFLIDNNLSDINSIKQYIQFYIYIPVTLFNKFNNVLYEDTYIKLTEDNFSDFYASIIIIINNFSFLESFLCKVTAGDTEIKYDGVSDLFIYQSILGEYIPLLEEFNKICNESYADKIANYYENTKGFREYFSLKKYNNFGKEIFPTEYTFEKINYYLDNNNYNQSVENGNFWNRDIYINPTLLTFWFDFLNADTNELANISVPAIGQRTKVITDKNVKAINYPDIPEIIFKKNTDTNFELKSGYQYININTNTESLFRTSSKGKSAYERMEELIYNHSYATDQVTLQSIPIYYLEPNHHIYIKDNESHIDGEYVVDKITIPLNYKKTMSITATKAAPYLN